MNRRFFGTDGVRGPYGGPVVNEEFIARLGRAAARWKALAGARNAGQALALVGWDTRASGESLARAAGRGLAEAGARVILLGVLPTPAVARAVRDRRAALGMVITASHNPAADNGGKFFGAGGMKLTDDEESAIEDLIEETPVPAGNGSFPSAAGAAEDYVAAGTALLPARALAGWRIVLDTANGATCATSPAVLRGLGAEVIGLGDAPDGSNINAGVGSEHPEGMLERVRASGARLGIAHDGDGDRCVLCDELGGLLDGDEILVILALQELARNRLAGNTLVVTEQSNLGVDAALRAAGGKVVRTPVGDRYVTERMRREGARLGGEASGHIVCGDVSPTGDGLVAALKTIEAMQATGKPLSELRRALQKFPQRTAALRVKEKTPLAGLATLTAAIARARSELADRGRVLVRYSGTEPKLRFLVEGPAQHAVDGALARLLAAARADLGE